MQDRQPRRQLVIVGATVTAILAAASASAQQAEQAGTLDEVTVTARRVSENLQDTPIAVTALSGAALEERQIFATDKLTQVVPNLQFGTNAPLAPGSRAGSSHTGTTRAARPSTTSWSLR